MTTEQDPGAFIGHEPERAADSIPGGVRPDDERVAASQSESGVPGEPDRDSSATGEGTEGVIDPRGPAEAAARASNPDKPAGDEPEVPEQYR
jgi:hypothetical protein